MAAPIVSCRIRRASRGGWRARVTPAVVVAAAIAAVRRAPFHRHALGPARGLFPPVVSIVSGRGWHNFLYEADRRYGYDATHAVAS